MFSGRKKSLYRHAPDCEEPDDKDLEEHFEVLRNNIYRAAARPDSFWEGQHRVILTRLEKPLRPWAGRILQVWVPAAAMVLVCLFFFGRSSDMPVPDLVGGYDQNLLLEVERTLKQDYPDAFAPAAILAREVERHE